MAEARKLIDAKLGAWKKAGTPAPAVDDPPAIGAGARHVRRAAELRADELCGSARRRSRAPAPTTTSCSVMNAVIGGGPTGRLFMHLREEKGYTYGAYSNMSAASFRGTGSRRPTCGPKSREPALRDLMAEITRMRNEPVPAKEFEDGSAASSRHSRCRSSRRPRCSTTTSRAGCTSCRPTTGTSCPSASWPSRSAAGPGRREEVPRPGASADRRRRRSDEGRRTPEAVRDGRDIRYEWQGDREVIYRFRGSGFRVPEFGAGFEVLRIPNLGTEPRNFGTPEPRNPCLSAISPSVLAPSESIRVSRLAPCSWPVSWRIWCGRRSSAGHRARRGRAGNTAFTPLRSAFYPYSHSLTALLVSAPGGRRGLSGDSRGAGSRRRCSSRRWCSAIGPSTSRRIAPICR